MIQPFRENITTEGEFSVVFLNGHYSYCMVKIPALGEYRCQAQFGGSTTQVSRPSTDLVTMCKVLQFSVLYLSLSIGNPVFLADCPIVREMRLCEKLSRTL